MHKLSACDLDTWRAIRGRKTTFKAANNSVWSEKEPSPCQDSFNSDAWLTNETPFRTDSFLINWLSRFRCPSESISVWRLRSVGVNGLCVEPWTNNECVKRRNPLPLRTKGHRCLPCSTTKTNNYQWIKQIQDPSQVAESIISRSLSSWANNKP